MTRFRAFIMRIYDILPVLSMGVGIVALVLGLLAPTNELLYRYAYWGMTAVALSFMVTNRSLTRLTNSALQTARQAVFAAHYFQDLYTKRVGQDIAEMDMGDAPIN
ncbi:MAG TPA: hypothetical protein VIV09_16790 [Pseudolabrys sp.]